MLNMSSISFDFNGHSYQAIVRTKQTPSKEYHITIMNGELESVFYGNHIFTEMENGQLEADTGNLKINGYVLRLRKSIANALQAELKSTSFKPDTTLS